MIRELPCGTKIEYRYAEWRNLPLESRVLQNNGYPYDERWWPVDSQEWAILQQHSPDILRSLVPYLLDSVTLTPRG